MAIVTYGVDTLAINTALVVFTTIPFTAELAGAAATNQALVIHTLFAVIRVTTIPITASFIRITAIAVIISTYVITTLMR